MASSVADRHLQGIGDQAAGQAMLGRPPALVVENLQKSYDGTTFAVKDVSLTVADDEVLALLGPSGCGKTTTLRSVAGLEEPESGRIAVGGREVFRGDGRRPHSVPPERRGLSMVFQQYALWPHMDVMRNVLFGLRMRKVPRSEAEQLAEKALRLVRLWDFRHRAVGELSGGQQQRVALARAVAGRPRLVLFDEPLSNLDARLRQDMRLELLELRQSLGFAALYVTHDQEEAFSIASRIAIMSDGAIEQIGTPEQIWENPVSGFVAQFVGSTNRIVGRVGRPWRDGSDAGYLLQASDGPELAVSTKILRPAGSEAEAYVKIGDVELSERRPAGPNCWEAAVLLESYQGESVLVKVSVAGLPLISRQPAGWRTNSKGPLFARIRPDAVKCFTTVA